MNPSLSQNYHPRQLHPPPSFPPPPSAPPLSNDQPQPQPPPSQQCATGIPVHFVAPHHPVNVNWSSSLCGCCSDVPNCCLTCWCPCITFGQIAEIIDKGNTPCGLHGTLYTLIEAMTCCGCLYSCAYRTKMRSQYGLRESPCNDCLVHFCCEPCALCQEYRQLKHHGFDISLGWEANMIRQNYGVQMSPITPQGMFR